MMITIRHADWSNHATARAKRWSIRSWTGKTRMCGNSSMGTVYRTAPCTTRDLPGLDASAARLQVLTACGATLNDGQSIRPFTCVLFSACLITIPERSRSMNALMMYNLVGGGNHLLQHHQKQDGGLKVGNKVAPAASKDARTERPSSATGSQWAQADAEKWVQWWISRSHDK